MKRMRGPWMAFSLLSFAISSCCASGQSIYWEKQTTLRGPMTESYPTSFRDSQGNTYLSGLAEAQPYLEKTSPNGTVIWRYLEQDPNFYDAEVVCVSANPAGDCFVAGEYHPGGAGKPIATFIEAFNSTGALTWRTQPTDYIRGLATASNGDPLLATMPSLTVSRYSSADGSLVWHTNYLPSGNNPRIIAKAGLIYVLQDSSALSRIDETTGNVIWTHTVTPDIGFSNAKPVDIDVLSSGDAVYQGANSSSTPASNPFIEELSQADGSSLGRAAIPCSVLQDGYTRSVFASADGSIVWSGFDIVNNVQQGKAGKLSSTLQSLYTIAPGRGLFAAGPNASGGINAIYNPLLPTTLYFSFAGYDSTGNAMWNQPGASNGQLWDYALQYYPDALIAVMRYGTSNHQQVYGFTSCDNNTNALTTFRDNPPIGETTNRPLCIDHDAQGNLYVASGQGNFCAVSKYTAYGDLIWTTPIGGSPSIGPLNGWSVTEPASFAYSPLGNVILGMNCEFHDGTFGVAKLDAQTGKPVFVRLIGKGSGCWYSVSCVREDSSGDVIVAGGKADIATWTSPSQFVMRLSSASANQIWHKEFPNFGLNGPPVYGRPTPNLRTLALDSNDNVLLSGIFQSAGQASLITTKLSAAGSVVFSNSVSIGATAVQSTAVTYDNSGNSFVMSTIPSAIQVFAYDSGGNLLRQVTLQEVGLNGAPAPWARIEYNAKRNALTLMASGSNGALVITIQLNASSFAKNWEDRAGMNNPLTDAVVDVYGNVVLVGGTNNFYYSSPWIRKLRADTGAVVYSTSYKGKYATVSACGAAVTVGPDFYPVLAGFSDCRFGEGSFNGCIRGWDGFLVKFRG